MKKKQKDKAGSKRKPRLSKVKPKGKAKPKMRPRLPYTVMEDAPPAPPLPEPVPGSPVE